MVVPSADVSTAAWIVDRLLPFHTGVAGSVVPPGFEAYARVLYPAESTDGQVQWSEIARWAGRVYHPAMQFEAIATPVAGCGLPPQPWNGRVPSRMPPRQVATIVRLLRRFTETPASVWYLVWEGYGALEVRSPGRVCRSARTYFLFRGTVEDASDLGIGGHFPLLADYWFPEDRAWCVATDTDLFWAYVGGSAECVGALLSSSDLECVPADLRHGLTIESDAINRLSDEERKSWN